MSDHIRIALIDQLPGQLVLLLFLMSLLGAAHHNSQPFGPARYKKFGTSVLSWLHGTSRMNKNLKMLTIELKTYWKVAIPTKSITYGIIGMNTRRKKQSPTKNTTEPRVVDIARQLPVTSSSCQKSNRGSTCWFRVQSPMNFRDETS